MLAAMGRYVDGLTMWQRLIVAAIFSVSLWTLFYFFAMRTSLPAGWSVRRAELAILAVAAAGGALSRAVSRTISPVVFGAAAGVVLGGSEAYVSDVSVSFWQRVAGGLVNTPFTILLLVVIASAWTVAHVVLRRWRAWRGVRTMVRA